jgi:hypothetical protein
MNIKKILLPLIFIMSGYSFNANSEIYKIQIAYATPPSCMTFSVGDSISLPNNICNGVSVGSFTYGSLVKSGTQAKLQQIYSNGSSSYQLLFYLGKTSSPDCPSGQELINGLCQVPPEPEPEPEPYCTSPEFLALKQNAQQQCFATGSQDFSSTCDDETATHFFSCAPPPIDPDKCTPDSLDYPACLNPDPEPDPDPPECVPSQDNNWCDNPPCKIGFAGWPECEPWYNKDPTTPLDPLEPPTPDPIDPVPPRPVDPVNPQPPLQPGDAFNDSRVIGAIQNLNKDMNFGFSDINGALQLQTNVLSNTNELVYQGLLQDLKIHDNQIANDNKNTGNIMGGLGGIGESINGLGDAIGNIPTPVPYDDYKVVAELEMLNARAALECVPAPENDYCENPHGLNEAYISTMFGQLNDKLDLELSAADSSLLGAATDLITKPPVDESTVKPFLDLSTSILTGNDKCVAIDWFGYELGCEFSDKFKQIFGFLLYMWTLKVLMDILLEDITPNQKSYSHRRR